MSAAFLGEELDQQFDEIQTRVAAQDAAQDGGVQFVNARTHHVQSRSGVHEMRLDSEGARNAHPQVKAYGVGDLSPAGFIDAMLGKQGQGLLRTVVSEAATGGITSSKSEIVKQRGESEDLAIPSQAVAETEQCSKRVGADRVPQQSRRAELTDEGQRCLHRWRLGQVRLGERTFGFTRGVESRQARGSADSAGHLVANQQRGLAKQGRTRQRTGLASSPAECSVFHEQILVRLPAS